MVTPEQRRRLIQAANQEGVDPDALIREAESMSQGDDTGTAGQSKAVAERLLIGFLPWVKVRELREKLGLTDRVPGDEEFCIAFGIKRGFLAPIAVTKGEDDGT